MEKPAETQYPIHDLISKRWSPRAFAERPVEAEKLRSLFEAARWAPSSFNEQPWSFLVATKENRAEFDRLLACLVEYNERWVKTASVLMVSIAKLAFEKNGKENRHALHDVGLATENLVIQATALGLFAHGMAGFSVEKVRETYGISESHVPVAMWAIGYGGDAEVLDLQTRKSESAPRSRKPLEEFVFTGKPGSPAAFSPVKTQAGKAF